MCKGTKKSYTTGAAAEYVDMFVNYKLPVLGSEVQQELRRCPSSRF